MHNAAAGVSPAELSLVSLFATPIESCDGLLTQTAQPASYFTLAARALVSCIQALIIVSCALLLLSSLPHLQVLP
jgi:hypothetical protein